VGSFPAHACTAVTGYGLLGQALDMAAGSNLSLVLESMKLPLFPVALDLAEKGILTGGCKRNRDYLQDKVSIGSSVNEGLAEIAFDPQTSGGLLIALPEQDAKRLVEELQANAVNWATIVGHGALFRKISVALV